LERLSSVDRVPRQQDSKGVIKNLFGFRACNSQHSSLASGRTVFSSCGADPSRAKNGLSAPNSRCQVRSQKDIPEITNCGLRHRPLALALLCLSLSLYALGTGLQAHCGSGHLLCSICLCPRHWTASRPDQAHVGHLLCMSYLPMPVGTRLQAHCGTAGVGHLICPICLCPLRKHRPQAHCGSLDVYLICSILYLFMPCLREHGLQAHCGSLGLFYLPVLIWKPRPEAG
jgi:hypothetical protein